MSLPQASIFGRNCLFLADLDLHESQRKQTGNSRQAGSKNLGDRHAQRLNDSVLCLFPFLPLIRVMMTKDDGIVDGKAKLKHSGNGVGDEADLAEPVVRSLVHPDGHAECDQKNRNLSVCMARQQKNQNNDADENHQHHIHLFFKDNAGRVADLGINVGIIAAERFADMFDALDGNAVQLLAFKGHFKERRGVLKMLRILADFHGLDAVHLAEHRGQLLRLGISDIRYHNASVAVSNKLAFHDRQSLTGF